MYIHYSYGIKINIVEVAWPKYLRLIHFPRQLYPTDNVAPLVRPS